MKKLKNKAFTLIELLVVVAIIGILAAVGVTTFGGFQDKAKVAASKAISASLFGIGIAFASWVLPEVFTDT